MNTPPKSISYAIYVRKSEESEDRQVLSIPAQIKTLKALASQKGLRISQTFTDSASAFKINNRPEFNKLMQAIEKGKIQGILTWKANRLARNMIEGGQLIYMLQNSIIQSIETPNACYLPHHNTLPLTIEFGMANQFSKSLSDDVSRGMKEKAENGGWCFVAPMGYKNNKLEKTIEKDPKYFSEIGFFWELYLTGSYSLANICRIAKEQGFKTPKKRKIGGKDLRVATLQKIFTNPFYYGMIVYKGQILAGKHKAMVTKAEFDKVQSILESKSGKPKKTSNSYQFKLRGLFSCNDCGSSITAELKYKYLCPKCRLQRSGKSPHTCPRCKHNISQKTINKANTYTYYHCTQSKRVCPQKKYCLENKLLEQVSKKLAEVRFDEKTIDWAKKWSFHVIEKSNQKNNEQSKVLKRNIEHTEDKLNNLLEMRLCGELTAEEYSKHKSGLENDILRLKNRQKTFSNDVLKDKVKHFFDGLANLKECLESISKEDMKIYFGKLFSNSALKGDQLALQLRKPVSRFRTIVDASKGSFELPKNSITTKDNAVLNSKCLSWYSLVESIRTENDL